MVIAPISMSDWIRPLADKDTGAILQLVVVVVVMIVSAIGSLLKKKMEQPQNEKTPPSPPSPPGRWPPIGTTTGTTVPPGPVRRPGPSQTPPIARPTSQQSRAPQAAEPRDRRNDHIEQLERDRQERVGKVEQEMLERSQSLRRQAEGTPEEARIKAAAAAAQRIREASQKLRHSTEQAASARPALSSPERAAYRIVAYDRPSQARGLPDSLKALLAEPSWRTAIILTEILSPPVSLRDPSSPTGTTPPGLVR